MEWMLQVVDEIDDAVSITRLWCMGVHSEIGLSLAAALGAGAIIAAIWTGQEALLIFAAALVLSAAGALKVHGAQLGAS
jgi:hypothetical protein